MSDDKKKPLNDPKVGVEVIPKDSRNSEHREAAKKIGEKLKEKIEKAVDAGKSGGKEKQFDAAENEAEKAGKGASKKQIEKIKVTVKEKENGGDVAVGKEWTVKPKE